MVFSEYKLQQILYYSVQGFKVPTIIISRLLGEEGLHAGRVGVAKFQKTLQQTDSIAHRPGSGHPSKITAEIKALVEQKIRSADETTAVQLHAMLRKRGYNISFRTILRCYTSLGWTFRDSKYCQLIREQSKVKRLGWHGNTLQNPSTRLSCSTTSSGQMNARYS